jgi:hypothetical protein
LLEAFVGVLTVRIVEALLEALLAVVAVRLFSTGRRLGKALLEALVEANAALVVAWFRGIGVRVGGIVGVLIGPLVLPAIVCFGEAVLTIIDRRRLGGDALLEAFVDQLLALFDARLVARGVLTVVDTLEETCLAPVAVIDRRRLGLFADE